LNQQAGLDRQYERTKEMARHQAQAFAEKLRSLGVDPDQILPDQLL
jgi:hypothetical protein